MKRLLILGTTGTLLVCLFAGVAIAAIVTCVAGAASCNGTSNPDTITGSTSADSIVAKGGDDTIYTQPYPFAYNSTYDSDVVEAGPGADKVYANDGDDRFGGTSDYIYCGHTSGHTGDGKPDTIYRDPIDVIDNSCRDIETIYTNFTASCIDTLDNDFDGLKDYPNDPGCQSAQDDSEEPGFVAPHPAQCDDGIDNDADGFIDMADPQCINTAQDSEVG